MRKQMQFAHQSYCVFCQQQRWFFFNEQHLVKWLLTALFFIFPSFLFSFCFTNTFWPTSKKVPLLCIFIGLGAQKGYTLGQLFHSLHLDVWQYTVVQNENIHQIYWLDEVMRYYYLKHSSNGNIIHFFKKEQKLKGLDHCVDAKKFLHGN